MCGLVFMLLLCCRQVRAVVPVATAHTMAHLGAVVSIGAGAVGFVQVRTVLPLLSEFIVGHVYCGKTATLSSLTVTYYYNSSRDRVAWMKPLNLSYLVDTLVFAFLYG